MAEPATVYVVYAPYLPHGERHQVGGWELIPRKLFEDADALDPRTAELARGYVDLFALPDGARTASIGAYARPVTGSVGDEPASYEDIQDLRRALLVAVLDGNGSILVPESERDPNAGHSALTSENALVYAHGINREGAVTSTLSGSRIPLLHIGVPVLPHPDPDVARAARPTRIPPPGDLLIPSMPPRIDLELGGAAWESIRRDTEDAARLARAIDWLGLAWINAAVVVDDMRIPVLRAAFEVLFNEGDSEQLARSLGDLLEPDSEPKPREWATLAGKPRRGLLTDIAWWFIRFSFLRNALLHRDPVGVGAEDVRRHVDHAEAYLRRAIKETIAADGHDEIRRDAAWRELYRQALKRLGPAS